MHQARLHASLHAFAADAAATLAAAVASGQEVPFEVVEAGASRKRPGLFHYRPLTADYIESHWGSLLRLPSAQDAQAALAAAGDLRQYLATYAAERHASAPPPLEALRCFIHRVLDDCGGEFELRPERFEPAYRELHGATQSEQSELVVLALLRGLACDSPELELAEQTLLVPLARLEVLPPDGAWREPDGPATVLALLPPLPADPVARLRDVQTALRLYAPGVALAPLAWLRGQRAAWRALPIPGAGGGYGHVTIGTEQEQELCAFASHVARRRPTDGELAWALERFELGCEREDPLSGLTDHLLALRALLEPEGPRSGRLAGRVAALCALPEQRLAATERVAHAIALERAHVNGIDAGLDAAALVSEIEQHLRALLRDVVCGHLQPELVELADSLVWQQGEPEPSGELRVRRGGAAALPRDELPLEDYCAAEGDGSLIDELR